MADWKYWLDDGTEVLWPDPATDLPSGVSLSKPEFVAQFIEAYYERVNLESVMGFAGADDIIDPSALSVFFDGRDLSGIIKTMQFVLALTYFELDSFDLSSAYSLRNQPFWVTNISVGDANDYSDVTIATSEYLRSNYTSHVNAGTFGDVFRATNVHPSDKDFSDYRQVIQCQRGDIIGPWIFEDLRRAMTPLQSLVGPFRLSLLGTEEGRYRRYFYFNPHYPDDEDIIPWQEYAIDGFPYLSSYSLRDRNFSGDLTASKSEMVQASVGVKTPAYILNRDVDVFGEQGFRAKFLIQSTVANRATLPFGGDVEFIDHDDIGVVGYPPLGDVFDQSISEQPESGILELGWTGTTTQPPFPDVAPGSTKTDGWEEDISVSPQSAPGGVLMVEASLAYR